MMVTECHQHKKSPDVDNSVNKVTEQSLEETICQGGKLGTKVKVWPKVYIHPPKVSSGEKVQKKLKLYGVCIIIVSSVEITENPNRGEAEVLPGRR